MKAQLVTVEAGSLDEADSILRSKIPTGCALLSKRIIAGVAPEKVAATGATLDAAFSAAASQVPSGAPIVDKTVTQHPARRAVTVRAPDESTARHLVQAGLPAASAVLDVTVASPPRRGFLGLGGRPGVYELTVVDQATVEISYRLPVKIEGTVGPVLYKRVLDLLSMKDGHNVLANTKAVVNTLLQKRTGALQTPEFPMLQEQLGRLASEAIANAQSLSEAVLVYGQALDLILIPWRATAESMSRSDDSTVGKLLSRQLIDQLARPDIRTLVAASLIAMEIEISNKDIQDMGALSEVPSAYLGR